MRLLTSRTRSAATNPAFWRERMFCRRILPLIPRFVWQVVEVRAIARVALIEECELELLVNFSMLGDHADGAN
jgi:hypothetical protein